MDVMRQTSCFVVNPSTINNFADLFNCTPVGRASDLMMAPAYSFQLSWLGPDNLSLFNCWTSVVPAFQRWLAVEWWILMYMFAVLIPWWVEVLHADRTTSMCIWTTAEPRSRSVQRKTGLSPSVIYYWPFQGDASAVVYSIRQCPSAFCLSLTYCSIYLR